MMTTALAARVVETGRDGDLLAEIAAERHRADARVGNACGADRREGVVAAAVVDEDDLPGCDETLSRIGTRRSQSGRDVRALVVDRESTTLSSGDALQGILAAGPH